jgi:hypothetical protein
MNREYLEAKVDLCLNQAEIDLEQQEIARAIANLRRANYVLGLLVVMLVVYALIVWEDKLNG